MLGGRRRLDDANATGLDDGNATSIDDAVTWTGFISYAALSRDSVPHPTTTAAPSRRPTPAAAAAPPSRSAAAEPALRARLLGR